MTRGILTAVYPVEASRNRGRYGAHPATGDWLQSRKTADQLGLLLGLHWGVTTQHGGCARHGVESQFSIRFKAGGGGEANAGTLVVNIAQLGVPMLADAFGAPA